MLRVNNLKLKPDHSEEQLVQAIKKTLGLKNEYKMEYDVVKRSIDARHKPDIMYVYSIDVKKISKNGNDIDLKRFLKKNANVLFVEKNIYEFPVPVVDTKKHISEEERPVIIVFRLQIIPAHL